MTKKLVHEIRFKKMIAGTVLLLAICLSVPSSSKALIGVKEGDAPDTFTLKDLQGAAVHVGSDFGRKPVILVFWELAMSKSFLDYSLDELRFLNEFYKEYGNKTDLKIFGIYTPEEEREIPDEEMERVKNLVTSNKIKFPILIDEGFKIFRQYGVIALPSTVMVGAEGKINFIYPSFPLAAQPLFDSEIKKLIGRADPEKQKDVEKKGGKDSHSVRLYNYALQMYKKGLDEQALSPLQKSVEIDGNNGLSHNLMGIILWKRGNFEGAADEFNRAIQIDSRSAPAHFNYGLLLLENNRYGEAEKHIQTSLSIQGNMPEAHYVLGILYKKAGNTKDALKELNSALSLFEKRAISAEADNSSQVCRISTMYTLSVLYSGLGDDKKAMDLLRKATEISLGQENGAEEGLYRSRDMMIYE